MTLITSIAANRFGLSARPGELRAIGTDAKGWLLEQVKRPPTDYPALANLPSSADVVKTLIAARNNRRQARASDDARKKPIGLGQQLRPIYLQQLAARYEIATQTSLPFCERLVHFWTNHFAVSADKVQVTALAATLENEVIRRNLHGSFARLLLAVESHPAMILYLDNQASIGPHSQLAIRAQRRLRNKQKLGLNENLAREILELHTLGVDGGYSQTDVTAFAAALTGWSIGGGFGPLREGSPGTFEFRDNAHEPGAKTILGKRYAEIGIAQPRAVLADLARHPATAKHIATKLARHFIADAPPASAIDRLTHAFLRTEGDLQSVYRELLALSDAWNQQPQKFKTPHEFVISAMRMLDFTPAPQVLFGTLQTLGQRPYMPGSPAGWADTADHWDGSDALLKRIEWADAVSQRYASKAQPLDLAQETLGQLLDEHTRVAISRAASAAQGLTLLLASPEFQRR
jgi:uncharacterized protein (DUF1800 family)